MVVEIGPEIDQLVSERSMEQIRELLDSLYRVDSGRILATIALPETNERYKRDLISERILRGYQ